MRVSVILIFAMVFSSCVRNKSGAELQNNVTANVKVFEVIQATSYTYLKVKEKMAEI